MNACSNSRFIAPARYFCKQGGIHSRESETPEYNGFSGAKPGCYVRRTLNRFEQSLKCLKLVRRVHGLPYDVLCEAQLRVIRVGINNPA